MIGKSYIITSQRFAGEIELVYDQSNNICGFELRTELTPEQLRNFFRHFPITVADVDIYKKSNTTSVYEVPEDLSFDRFWENWPGKQANKERAKTIWDKMSKKDKVRCMWSLKAYKRYIDRNAHWYNPQYPDSYLSPRKPGWLNDFNIM